MKFKNKILKFDCLKYSDCLRIWSDWVVIVASSSTPSLINWPSFPAGSGRFDFTQFCPINLANLENNSSFRIHKLNCQDSKPNNLIHLRFGEDSKGKFGINKDLEFESIRFKYWSLDGNPSKSWYIPNFCVKMTWYSDQSSHLRQTCHIFPGLWGVTRDFQFKS